MTYIFMDDGLPDARDFDSNYIVYDQDDLESMLKARSRIQESKRAQDSLLPGQMRSLENAIELENARIQRAESRHAAFFGRFGRVGAIVSQILIP